MSPLCSAKRLCDYTPPAYLISTIDLTFELDPSQTRVTAKSVVRRQTEQATPLVLVGQHLKLVELSVNGTPWTDYHLDPERLTVNGVPAEFELRIVTEIAPKDNFALEGLYLSNGAYCTQCEAEGFRRITYYLDRPDVMAVFTTHIIANADEYPFLLSNGNSLGRVTLPDGRSRHSWHDPFPKPCYLFALVAGQFDEVTDSYVTVSGREVALKFYVDPGHAHLAQFAVQALQRAMAFDEAVYGREYDLDIYMVVAVDFFNMGAMENKGLNVFNSKYVLADNSTATDTDFFNVESIIAHEYFHNWTGNRVTCRDWFQLSLKEGLTVFRDQQFSAAMGSPTLCRIDAIKTIRTAQFAEDAGPMAHPIRPELVMEMNNFYTVTVYDKGAEVIRMLHTLLGEVGFRRGMDLYFSRHDGQAVTCDDFVAALADANSVDLQQFKRWYAQAGTPLVTASLERNSDDELVLTLRQTTEATADGSAKLPFLMPVRLELIAQDGTALLQQVLTFAAQEQQFKLGQFPQAVVPVLFADFSAPVKLHYSYNLEQLLLIAQSCRDGVARWDAMQTFWSDFIATHLGHSTVVLPDALVHVYRQWLTLGDADLALVAELLTIPSFDTLAGQFQPLDVDALLRTRNACLQALADALSAEFLHCYATLFVQPYRYDQLQVATRLLRNCCLDYITAHQTEPTVATAHYQHADNMTDRLAALNAICRYHVSHAAPLLHDFYQRFGDNPQLFDKLSASLVSVPTADVYANITLQTARPQFDWKNPNRVRAVFLAFSQLNPMVFHATDGRGYQLLADVIAKLDPQNPQLAARLVTPLLSWRQFDPLRQQLIRTQLLALSQLVGISSDLNEKVQRSL